MMKYSPEFLAQLEHVNSLRTSLNEETKKLQDLCPHVHLTGESTFPRGTPGNAFTDCSLCGMSSYYLREDRGRRI